MLQKSWFFEKSWKSIYVYKIVKKLELYTHNIVLWIRDGNRYCQKCGHKLQKYGLYKNGSQKWYCPHCHSYIKIDKNHKKKQKIKLWLFKYFEYLTHSKRMSEYGCHRSTFWRNTKIFKNRNIFIPESKDRHLVIYLDGLRVNKKAYLIASNGKHIMVFCLVDYESSNNWKNFIKKFNESKYVVCDGQNGLIKAIKSIMQANDWQTKFKIWKDKYYEFICQKRVNPETGEIWFTHTRLRSTAFNLSKLILNKTLFNFLDTCKVKRMNNVLEGVINSPIRHLLNCHKGTNFIGKQKIVEIYLLKRSMFGTKFLCY